MPLRSADLAPLLARPAGPGVAVRQGVVIAWNRLTAENLVRVGDTVVQNLPILNTSEAAILAAGDVVSILTAGSTWGILGRFTLPGTPEAVSGIRAITDRIVVASDPGEGTRASPVYGDLTGANVGPQVTVTIGPSGRALVFWACDIQRDNEYQTLSSGDVSVAVGGATYRAASAEYSLGYNHQQPAGSSAGAGLHSWAGQWSTFHLFTDLNPGETRITMQYSVPYSSPSLPTTFAQREIAVFVL